MIKLGDEIIGNEKENLMFGWVVTPKCLVSANFMHLVVLPKLLIT